MKDEIENLWIHSTSRLSHPLRNRGSPRNASIENSISALTRPVWREERWTVDLGLRTV